MGTVGEDFIGSVAFHVVSSPNNFNSHHGSADTKEKKCQIKEEEFFCAAGTGDVTRRGGSACAQTLQLLPGYFQFSFIDFTSLLVNIEAS